MSVENGEWVMKGLEWDNPYRIRTWQELVNWINEIGFLPLFGNEVTGFSAEEHTSSKYWWTGNRREDPWEWREIIAASGKVAYGKFFGNKAGFISVDWLPYFANYRRDGYDFDAKWADPTSADYDKWLPILRNETNGAVAKNRRQIEPSYNPVLCINVNVTKQFKNFDVSFFANNMFRSTPLQSLVKNPGDKERRNSNVFFFGLQLTARIK